MSGPVRSTSCRTSANRSYRWTAVVTIVAMLGFAGFVLAASGTTKVVPVDKDVKVQKALTATQLGDAPDAAPVTTSAKSTGITPLDPPSNDECSGAIVIPPTVGLDPVVSAPASILEATPVDTPEAGFTCANTDRTIWYSFTPNDTGAYVLSTCFGNGATGSTVYDTVISVFTACGGATVACADSPGCGATPPGGDYNDQATTSAVLTAGTTYYIALGHWADDVASGGTGVDADNQHVAVKIQLSPAPANDTCGADGSSATPLTLNRYTVGTTASATNDYRSANACFTGNGQILSSSNGLDACFSFTPPADGLYSVRYVQDESGAALRAQSPVLYITSVVPPVNPAAGVPGCIKAANRSNDQLTGSGNRSEEIDCVSLTGGHTYYVIFDDRFTANPGGPLGLEVTQCNPEVEPNDDIASATPYPGCVGKGGTAPSGTFNCLKGTPNQFAVCDPTTEAAVNVCGRRCVTAGTACASDGDCTTAGDTCRPAAATNCAQASTDVDFWSVGTPPAGAKVFASAVSQQANNSDFEMRITNTTDTLGYDDDDGTSWTGSNQPIIGGVIADGNPLYVRVSSKNASEPYHLYWHVEAGAAQAEDDSGVNGNDGLFFANPVTGGGFVSGVISVNDSETGETDIDCFRFVANEGDNMAAFADNNPTREGGTITNVWPRIFSITPQGNGTIPFNPFIGQVHRNIVTPSPGVLDGTTPSVVSEMWEGRARYTGTYFVCWVTTDIAAAQPSDIPPAGSYPLPYQGSVSLDCGPIPSPASRNTDVSIAITGPAGPVNTGDVVDYTITVTNNGTDIAQDVRLLDTLPPELVYLNLGVDDGFAAANLGCLTLPTPGTADAPIDCTNYSIAPGATTTWFLTAQVANCIGAGLDVTNSASISTLSTDPNTANDSASVSNTTTQTGSCQDLLCDDSGCITNECTINDTCDGSTCTSVPLNCDDESLCTDDSCDPADAETPCVNDASQLGDLCFDGNDCTVDGCDDDLFCVFPPTGSGSACDDFLNCTTGDLCDGFGGCIGASVCDDGQPCTDDFADEGNACACDNPLSFPGTVCEDGNACTTGTTCDGSSGSASGCTGGGPTDCNDNNPCTDDSCDSVLGCVHTAVVCDDGNSCNGVETCDPDAGGCQAGTPVVCIASDQCHVAGTCNPGTGLCSDPAAADGTTCDDGNAATDGDVCTAGVCAGSTCSSTNDPRSKNYYKKLCSNRNAGDQITDADAVCVGENTATFAGFSTAAQVCEVLTKNQPTKCDKAEGDLMALALNVCHERVCPSDGLTSQCGSSTSVGQSYGLVDAAVSDPGRTQTTCGTASCFANEINTGSSLDNFTPASLQEGGNIRVLGKELPGTIERN